MTIDTEGSFDVSIGSRDRAGIHDLTRIFLFDTLGKVFPTVYFNIYRIDDPILVLNTNEQAQNL